MISQKDELQDILIEKLAEVIQAKAQSINHPEILETRVLNSLKIVRTIHFWVEYVIRFKIVQEGKTYRPHFTIKFSDSLRNSRLCVYQQTRIRV